MTTEREAAAARVRAWVFQYEGLGGLDPELIHTAHAWQGTEPAQLLVSDLVLLAAEGDDDE